MIPEARAMKAFNLSDARRAQKQKFENYVLICIVMPALLIDFASINLGFRVTFLPIVKSMTTKAEQKTLQELIC